MNTRHLIGFLGWVAAYGFGIAILNYFVKFINKKVISKLGKDKKQIVDYYRIFMKLIIKYHKLAGTVAVVAVASHFFIAFSNDRTRLTGIVAALIMACIFLIGVYGAFISKNRKGIWLKAHRLLSFLLIIALAIHI
jgi:hypothetical protein